MKRRTSENKNNQNQDVEEARDASKTAVQTSSSPLFREDGPKVLTDSPFFLETALSHLRDGKSSNGASACWVFLPS